MIEIIAYILISSYTIFSFALLITWLSFPDFNEEKKVRNKMPFVSILIPVRNEEKNIANLLQDIDRQLFNKNNFEVIVINDASTDNTVFYCENFLKTSNLSLEILHLPYIENNTSPKKRAISAAIQKAAGELILTTDGDCRMGTKWLSSIVDFYQITNAFFISSPVSFTEKKSKNGFQKIWNSIQIIEFGSLVGSAACAIFWQRPTMCSGANLAYKKDAFLAVNGYEGNEQIASGDDEFLMHKIANQFPDKVQFFKSIHALVETDSHTSFRSFYRQRKRWASKWKFYTNWQPTAMAIYVFMTNFVTIFALLSGNWILFSLKFLPEFLFLATVVWFLKKRSSLIYIPLTQLIYPFYVVFFGLIVQGKNEYIWKERKLK